MSYDHFNFKLVTLTEDYVFENFFQILLFIYNILFISHFIFLNKNLQITVWSSLSAMEIVRYKNTKEKVR